MTSLSILSQHMTYFTVDDFHAAVPDHPPHPNAVGAVMRQADELPGHHEREIDRQFANMKGMHGQCIPVRSTLPQDFFTSRQGFGQARCGLPFMFVGGSHSNGSLRSGVAYIKPAP